MALEQVKPNKPNFKLIGILCIVGLPLLLIAAWVLVRLLGGDVIPHHGVKHATSLLAAPPLRPVPATHIYLS